LAANPVSALAGNHGVSVYDGARIIRGPGGATVEDEQGPIGPRIPKKGEHDENLAELMDANERRSLATRLLEYLELDKDSRKDWEERERRGLALMGVEDIPNDDESAGYVNSPGQAQVKLPMMLEASITFEGRAIAELFPATGPVKCTVIGKKTKERMEQADRVETFGNYYFTQVDEGYFPDTDQMLLYLPLAGSAFRKASQNWVTGLPELRYVKATNFIVPYAAKSLEDAPRYADRYTMSGQDVRRAMEKGMFADVPLQRPADGESKHSKTSDISDMRTFSQHDDDALYDIVEYHIQLELEVDEDGAPRGINESWGLLPYIVLVEKTNQEILMIRRNWAEDDKQHKKIIWFAHHKFFPGLGFYGWGYPHLIGSLQKAINDSANALLDSGFAANFQGGFVTKEGKAAGMSGEIELEHGKWKVIEGAFDELQKALWSPDFKPPSPALANLMEQLLQMGQRFCSITDVSVGDGDNRGPVGTTIALIEQSAVVPTAIHKRLHVSMGKEFKMWARLMYLFMPDQYPYEVGEKEQQLFKSDFDGRIDVVPVSDPNIWSQTQRIALCQGTLELQAQAPDLYKPQQRVEAHRRMMQAMRVPDIDAVGPSVETPKYLDPIAEFQMILLGAGVKAFETQDQAGHIAIHNNQRAILLGSPAFLAMLPERQQMVMTALDTHIADHMGLEYRRMIMGQAGIPLPPLEQGGVPTELPPEIEQKVTQVVVQRLPPPPPPAAAPQGGVSPQDEAAALKAKTQAAIEAKAQESEASVVRDTKAFTAEERRKEIAFENEQRRTERKAALEESIKRQQLEGEEQRKNVATGTQLVREGAKAKLQQRTQEALTRQKLQHGDAATNQKLSSADRLTGQKLKHTEATTGQKLQHADAGHEQQLEHKDRALHQDLEHKEKVTKQDLRHADEDHRKLMEQGDEEHQQQQRHGDEDHQAELERGGESHEAELERGGKAHKQSLKQTAETGKLKVQQAKEQVRAKKQAAKKSGARK